MSFKFNHSALAVLALAALTSGGAMAQQFDNGIPASWTCTGSCGTSADVFGTSVVSQPMSSYGWVSSESGIDGISPFSSASVPYNSDTGLVGNTNGSLLRSGAFTASRNEVLKFQFNYVTSDGASFADYAWARLLNATDGSQAAVIFTARTNQDLTKSVVPGFGIPSPQTTLTPGTAAIINGGYTPGVVGPAWSPLGAVSSGSCYADGCGYTGWVGASYTVTGTGSYVLEFGVTNWDDTAFDSGMAFNAVTIGGGHGDDDVSIDDGTRHISAVPEAQTWAMSLAGLALIGAVARRRQHAKAA
jgi:MYXO-CTERM domain-containing protein